MPYRGRSKTLVVVSGGGHFEQAIECLEAFRNTDVVLVCYRYLGDLAHFKHPRIRRIRLVTLLAFRGWALYLSLMLNALQFLWIFVCERPDILFSTGSEIAIIPFILGKVLWRTHNIFLETACGAPEGTGTAHWLYRWSDLFLVQWPHQVRMFGPKARYEGRLL